jgi:hypothetical protein
VRLVTASRWGGAHRLRSVSAATVGYVELPGVGHGFDGRHQYDGKRIQRSTRGPLWTSTQPPIWVNSTHVSLGYRVGIEEVAPARELAITHSEQMEEVGLAGLAGGLDAQRHVPGDDHSFTLSDELLNV